MARPATVRKVCCGGDPFTLRAELLAIIERAFALPDWLDGNPDAESSLCGPEVGRCDDQAREGLDDDGIADDDGPRPGSASEMLEV